MGQDLLRECFWVRKEDAVRFSKLGAVTYFFSSLSFLTKGAFLWVLGVL